jgi:hypothetical protein
MYKHVNCLLGFLLSAFGVPNHNHFNGADSGKHARTMP